MQRPTHAMMPCALSAVPASFQAVMLMPTWHVDLVATCDLRLDDSRPLPPSFCHAARPQSRHQRKRFYSSIMIIIARQCCLVPLPVDTVPVFIFLCLTVSSLHPAGAGEMGPLCELDVGLIP